MSYQGNPCWYELGTSDLDAAQAFYGPLLGWDVKPAGMEGFDYRLATTGGDMVAGMMALDAQEGAPPPNWLIYFAVDDCDATAAQITAAGGSVIKEPADIPGTGRFAVAADPMGAVFGILQPDMSQMSDADRQKAETTGAFDQSKPGHGNWHELMSTDPEAAFAFYSGLFGWTKSTAMDMGEMGTYQLMAHKGRDIGAVMGLGDAPQPVWLPYFGTAEPVSQIVERIKDTGGHVNMGPVEVPGPAFIAVGNDPQGAWFAVVGTES